MKILFICLSGAGDVLMATPLIKELRLGFPDGKIDVLVMQGKITKALFKNNKDVDKVIYFNFMKEGFFKSVIFCGKLRKQKYDLSITTYPQARLHYSVVSWLIHAKKRIGFNYETQKLKLNKLLFTRTINENFAEHVVENNLKVLKILGKERKLGEAKLVFNLAKEDENFAGRFFKENKIKKAVVIHPGSGTIKNFILKRWHKNRFAELCRKICKNEKMQIILVGGEDEEKLKDGIIKISGLKEGKEIFNLKADINEVAAVIKKSFIVIANDAIIGHIAAALGTFVISIFGPTSYQNTGPFTEKKEIICKRNGNIKPYMHGARKISKKQAACLNRIEAEEVYNVFKGVRQKWK